MFKHEHWKNSWRCVFPALQLPPFCQIKCPPSVLCSSFCVLFLLVCCVPSSSPAGFLRPACATQLLVVCFVPRCVPPCVLCCVPSSSPAAFLRPTRATQLLVSSFESLPGSSPSCVFTLLLNRNWAMFKHDLNFYRLFSGWSFDCFLFWDALLVNLEHFWHRSPTITYMVVAVATNMIHQWFTPFLSLRWSAESFRSFPYFAPRLANDAHIWLSLTSRYE